MEKNVFVYWKEPGKKEIFTIARPHVKKISEPLLSTEGFLFFPYKKNNSGYFIKGEIEETSELTFPQITGKRNASHIHDTSKKYIYLVKKALEKMREDNFEKVVLARSDSHNLPDAFRLKTFFEKLCKTYTNAFVYCISLEKEIWIGATPEVFLKKEDNLFLTFALAGTRPLNPPLLFGEKEKEEQHYVKKYIVDLLKKQNVQPIEISETAELNTGNLKHLITEIRFTTKDPLDFICQLHPTPAVCGEPVNKAEKFIDENENLDREYYSGFLGPVFKRGDFSFWVNLRCAKIDNGQITFYAGAGITKDSSPEAEWHETENKMDTLRKFL